MATKRKEQDDQLPKTAESNGNEISAQDMQVVTKKLKTDKPKKKKRRPARVQKEPGTVDNTPPQTGTVYNIWYLKWSGGDRYEDAAGYSQRKAAGRCNIAKDSGYTLANPEYDYEASVLASAKASKALTQSNSSKELVPAGGQVVGETQKQQGSYFCLYFARGLCTQGKNCHFLHRLPTDDDFFPQTVDCFGRDKFADYRDDMGGTGSFLRSNRTLYVGRINESSGSKTSETVEQVVSRHFQEWGKIERIRVLNDRGVAFVTYSNEANAQFAKEAMAHQSLDNDEVLNVRWASEDPNPQAQMREKKLIEKRAIQSIQRMLMLGSQNSQKENELKQLENSRSDVEAIEYENTENIENTKSNENTTDQSATENPTEQAPTQSIIPSYLLDRIAYLKSQLKYDSPVETYSSQPLKLVEDYESD